MNLSQLSAFREVMLCGTVSQAARNLGRTQPAISTAIASLEDELGMPLFERRSRRLHPVPEAHYLLAEATEIIGRMDTARENLQNLLGEVIDQQVQAGRRVHIVDIAAGAGRYVLSTIAAKNPRR